MKLTKLDGEDCPDKITCPAFYGTDEPFVVVRGYAITDPDVLAQLDLPAGETAVKIPIELWERRGGQ